MHAVLTSPEASSEGRYVSAIRQTIRAGGCNCSRAFFAGAACAASLGASAIPTDWIEKATAAEEVVDAAVAAFVGASPDK